MAKTNNLDHAKHNHKVCNYLNAKEQYSDWVITTAFYSAMKFVEHKLFPMNLLVSSSTQIIQDFDEYYTTEYFSKGSQINKHGALVELIEEQLPEISSSYRWLKDASYTARYHDYEYDRAMAKCAKSHLENIKNACTTGTNTK